MWDEGTRSWSPLIRPYSRKRLECSARGTTTEGKSVGESDSAMVSSTDRAFFEVSGVDMNFGALAALQGVSFEVEKGTIFGIAGPNGAGKTTLLNVISGVCKPSRGEVYLEGVKISGLKPMNVCYRGVARTFQIPVVFPTLTVLENIKIGMIFGHGPGQRSSKRISEFVDFVGLGGKENLLAANIDLYSRKLLMLAAALSTEPKLLLLDEPLSGLNFREIEDFLRVVKELNQEMGATILIVEHLFDKLVETSQEIMILDFGRQIYLGPSDTVADDPTVIEVYLGMKRHA
jgi:branched-chain amino acid transport system ATP-binding protein